MQLALDPSVYVIVSLRRRGHTEDEVSAMKAIIDSVDKAAQQRIAKLIALEDEDVVRALVSKLPAVRDALVQGGEKTPAEIIESVAKSFEE